jgi:hypothetical protein
MNPALDPAEVPLAYEHDPAAAEAEYGAQFRTDVEVFLSRETLQAAVVAGRHVLAPVSGRTYVGFVDPSGGAQDAMTLAIAHRDRERVRLDFVAERRAPFSPAAVVAEFAQVPRRYRVRIVTGTGSAASRPGNASLPSSWTLTAAWPAGGGMTWPTSPPARSSPRPGPPALRHSSESPGGACQNRPGDHPGEQAGGYARRSNPREQACGIRRPYGLRSPQFRLQERRGHTAILRLRSIGAKVTIRASPQLASPPTTHTDRGSTGVIVRAERGVCGVSPHGVSPKDPWDGGVVVGWHAGTPCRPTGLDRGAW